METCPFLSLKRSSGSTFDSVVSTIIYAIVGFFVVYFIFSLYEEFNRPSMMSNHTKHRIMIDKCPLASSRDQRMAVIENKLDKLFLKVDDLFETIMDNIHEDDDEEQEEEQEEEEKKE